MTGKADTQSIDPSLPQSIRFIRLSVDGLYRDGTVREMHEQCFITRRETTSGAPKPHRHRLSPAIGTAYESRHTFVSSHEKSLICDFRIFVIIFFFFLFLLLLQLTIVGRSEAANCYTKLIYDGLRCASSPSDRSSPIPCLE